MESRDFGFPGKKFLQELAGNSYPPSHARRYSERRLMKNIRVLLMILCGVLLYERRFRDSPVE